MDARGKVGSLVREKLACAASVWHERGGRRAWTSEGLDRGRAMWRRERETNGEREIEEGVEEDIFRD